MQDELKNLLQQVEDEPLPDQAVAVARWLLVRALELQSREEKRQQNELNRMIQSPTDKATLITLTDQAFRSHVPHRAVDQLIHILDVQGIPRFFTPLDRTLLKGFQSFGSYLPDVAVPLMKKNMRKETANVVLPAEWDHLSGYLRKRHGAGLRMNVNFLGEALLGEGEAQARMNKYLEALTKPDLEVLSVKISTIYSQINPLAYEETIQILADRLEQLYRKAAENQYVRPDGTSVPKFVYLDMEEYRDLRITSDLFMRTLDRPGLEKIEAGIALQAYVPDSYLVQKQITEWAEKRISAGGAPVTVRLVKGANMEMERVEASHRGWAQAPYKIKADTDRNYKRMLHYGLENNRTKSVCIGVASHNLFDVAYAMALASREGCIDEIQFEMLEGMANHQRRALQELEDNILLYAPACRKEDFIHAIGYLIRRLDENTGPDNFLRHTFKLEVDSPDWGELKTQFKDSCEGHEDLLAGPRRTQDRNLPSTDPEPGQAFENEADTDFALEQNQKWANEIIADWQERPTEDIPLFIGGEQLSEGRQILEGHDPSRPGTVVVRSATASRDDIDHALDVARNDADGWRSKPVSERRTILQKVAGLFRERRGELMGCAMAECGKILPESDPEVSEAVDFLEYYAEWAERFGAYENLSCEGKGVAIVVPPWNFPIAIPCGGVAAALAAGNTVLIKPSPDAVLTAWYMCKCFWDAGVPGSALQFVPTPGVDEAQYLVGHEKADVVIFTGGTETAQTILRHKPDLEFFAETGGKNATIVTALADRDNAIKHVLQSAFGHGGQKCSATSLLILEDEIYDDPIFKEQLADAARSLHVDSAWNPATRMGPIIRAPNDALQYALTSLEEGEEWVVKPEQNPDIPQLFSPGIKWGVQPGSRSHLTEFFGPVLGVMRAKNLMHAINLVHETGYGLTSGLESLDEREQELWQHRIKAGNLYINRSTTGAIVHRQPFGGMGKSAYGPGIKAGGPNYVLQFMKLSETSAPETASSVSQDAFLAALFSTLQEGEVRTKLESAVGSYRLNMEREFSREHDDFKLIGQDNIRRYLPVENLRIRIHETDGLFDVLARVCAARIAGCQITISIPHDLQHEAVALLMPLLEDHTDGLELVEESDDELAQVIREGAVERVRYSGQKVIPAAIWELIADTGIYLAHAPVMMEGRVELLWYLREQSLCVDYHRYGNLGGRGDEQRAEPL